MLKIKKNMKNKENNKESHVGLDKVLQRKKPERL